MHRNNCCKGPEHSLQSKQNKHPILVPRKPFRKARRHVLRCLCTRASCWSIYTLDKECMYEKVQDFLQVGNGHDNEMRFMHLVLHTEQNSEMVELHPSLRKMSD